MNPETSLELYETKKNDRFLQAKALANSELCPKQFREKTADILLVMHQADVIDCDYMAALANMHVVHGTAGYSSKFLIALANRHGVFSGPIRYKTEGSGKDAIVTAWAKLADGDIVESIAVGWDMAQAAGWTKNPKYKELPELMFRYRSAAFLIRTTCPEVTMGMLSTEEIEDMHYAEAREVRAEPSAAERLQALAAPKKTESRDWKGLKREEFTPEGQAYVERAGGKFADEPAEVEPEPDDEPNEFLGFPVEEN